MNANVVYLIVVLILTWIYLKTRSLKSNENEYFVLNKSEGVLGLSLSFYASGMGLWILTSPAEVAWYGLGYDIYGYALSAATPFLMIYIFCLISALIAVFRQKLDCFQIFYLHQKICKF